MTYQETLEYMFDQLPMYHRIGKLAYKADMTTALFLDAHYHHPHQSFKTIHVAGTNGKGSVSHSIAAILQAAGFKTGLFTSPHLKDFRERIRINGQMIPETEVTAFIESGKSIFENTKPSFFEMTSALAFEYFAKEKVDVAIIEVGMGGRLDSTNIITPVLSVITNIGLDHTEFLGDTLDKIAKEKAGIIKQGIPVIIGEYHSETWPVFEAIAKQMGSSIILASEKYNVKEAVTLPSGKQLFTISEKDQECDQHIEIDLLGYYQQKNICTILAVTDQLRVLGFEIALEAEKAGLCDVMGLTGLLGRWQVLGQHPLVVCDTGHNKHGLALVVQQILQVPCKRLHIVLGFVNDKDVSGVLQILPAQARYYFTQAAIPRAMNAGLLLQKANEVGLKGEAFASVSLAMEAVRSVVMPEDFVFIGGSNFVVAELL